MQTQPTSGKYMRLKMNFSKRGKASEEQPDKVLGEEVKNDLEDDPDENVFEEETHLEEEELDIEGLEEDE